MGRRGIYISQEDSQSRETGEEGIAEELKESRRSKLSP
jgi:hypothetical protein